MVKRRGLYITTMGFTGHELGMFDAAMEATGAVDRVTIVRLALREFCRKHGVAVRVPAIPQAEQLLAAPVPKQLPAPASVKRLPAAKRSGARAER